MEKKNAKDSQKKELSKQEEPKKGFNKAKVDAYLEARKMKEIEKEKKKGKDSKKKKIDNDEEKDDSKDFAPKR